MLRPWNSQTPLGSGLTERECPRCRRPVELPLGELCRACKTLIERRASRAALWVSALSTVVISVWIFADLPDNQQSRMVAVAGIVTWFLLTNTIVRRAMREWKR
jgi:hypothetical protein